MRLAFILLQDTYMIKSLFLQVLKGYRATGVSVLVFLWDNRQESKSDPRKWRHILIQVDAKAFIWCLNGKRLKIHQDIGLCDFLCFNLVYFEMTDFRGIAITLRGGKWQNSFAYFLKSRGGFRWDSTPTPTPPLRLKNHFAFLLKSRGGFRRDSNPLLTQHFIFNCNLG